MIQDEDMTQWLTSRPKDQEVIRPVQTGFHFLLPIFFILGVMFQDLASEK